jgi:hypothetical protein
MNYKELDKAILNIFERHNMTRVIGHGLIDETATFSFRNYSNEGQGVNVIKHLEKNLYAFSFFNFNLLDSDKYINITKFKNEELVDDLSLYKCN